MDELFEREGELKRLDATLDGLVQGHPETVVIEGPAGIGKTRLLGEMRRRATAGGIRVLSARGNELEREFPFGVARQLFEPVLGADGGEALSGAAAAARSVFDGAEADGEAAGFAILHGLYWLTLNVGGERPLVLAVDDLHWCDRPSLRFLAYLVPRLEGQPIVVGATLRSAEPGTDPVLLGEIVRDSLTSTIRPRPLGKEGTAELAGTVLGDGAEPSFVAACQKATNGNPLLLRELLGALAAEGVTSTTADADAVTRMDSGMVSRSVLLRLSQLPTDAVAVARATSVFAEGASIADIAALAGLDEGAAAEATGYLVRAEILRSETPIGFAHPLVREAVYRVQSPGERELAHSRAAQLLRSRGDSAEAVATHLLMTPPRGDAEVFQLLREAGQAAERRGAVDSAVSYLRRALAELPTGEERADVERELGLAESLVNGRAAAEHLRSAYAATADPALRAEVAHVLVRVVNFGESSVKAAEMARRFRDDLPAELVDSRQALEAFELSMIFWGAVDPVEAERLLPHLVPPPPEAGVGAKMMAATAAMIYAQLDRGAEECSELALAALAGGDLLRVDPVYLILALSMVLIVSDREEGIQVLDEVLAAAHRHGSLVAAAGTHMWRGAAHLWRGDLEEAEEMLKLARHEFDLWGFGTAADHWVAGFLAVTELERGDVAAARATLEQAGRPDPDDSGDGARYWGDAELLVLEAELTAPEELIAAADAFARQHARIGNPVTSWWRPTKIAALLRLDRRDEAIALAEEQLAAARRWGAPGIVGGSLRLLGQAGGGERGIALLEEAVRTLDGTPAKLEQAKALTALGVALRRERQPTEARLPLQRALDLATVCSATRVADQARAELQASGARPRTTVVGVGALTPSERRIAGMAAEELTNREIAQALFVTPKTVEVHLSNAYRKLEIRSRRQLRDALATAMA